MQILPCADLTALGSRVMLASLEGLPTLVVEPECVIGTSQSAGELVSDPPLQPAPAFAVVIGRRGVLQCGLAADRADFFETQIPDHVLSAAQISDFLDRL
ncbi:MAG: hypothetical protein FGM18_03715 [Burkholderiaceae bacterium]|nr:hypothetical protein [Burkholderiaceae bacterium]